VVGVKEAGNQAGELLEPTQMRLKESQRYRLAVFFAELRLRTDAASEQCTRFGVLKPWQRPGGRARVGS